MLSSQKKAKRLKETWLGWMWKNASLNICEKSQDQLKNVKPEISRNHKIQVSKQLLHRFGWNHYCSLRSITEARKYFLERLLLISKIHHDPHESSSFLRSILELNCLSHSRAWRHWDLSVTHMFSVLGLILVLLSFSPLAHLIKMVFGLLMCWRS